MTEERLTARERWWREHPNAPRVPRAGKVVRWIDKLTDGQIEELLVRIDRQMASTGIEPGAIRKVLRDFAANLPAAVPTYTLGATP